MFLDSGNPGKTCNSKIKLGPWKTGQHFSYTKTIWYAHWSDPLELEYKLLKSWPCYILAKGDNMKPLSEMLQHWRGYFVNLLEWSFCIKPLKTCTFFQLPRQWTGPSETSIWSNSPMKTLLCILIGVIIRICKRIQTPKNSCSCKHPSWIQVYIWTTPKPVNRPIWNHDLKYITSTDAILHTHSFDHF